MEDKFCEIFRTGKHTDSKGNTREWTSEDLEKIKNNFESKNPDVPICIGHPKTNSPAYGWIKSLKIAGNKLYAAFKNVQPEFEEAVKKGLFRTRSISLTKDLVPRHLAFLGAQAPAIKGMEQFCFADCERRAERGNVEFSREDPFSASNQEAESEDYLCIEFNDKANDSDDNVVRNGDESTLVDPAGAAGSSAPLERGGTSVKDSDEIGCSTNTPPAVPPVVKGVNEASSFDDGTSPPDVKEGEQMTEELEKQLAAKDEELAAAKKELEKVRQEALKKEFEEFCDSAIAEGNILPAQRENVLNLLFANTDSNINFDDGSSKTSNEVFKDFVKSLRQMDYQKIAKEGNVDGSANTDFSDFKAEDWESAITEEMSKAAQNGRDISPKEALQKVKKGI